MKILLLSQFFDPEPFFKSLPFAKALAKRGHDVEALTGFPNYPGGKVYEGYRIRFFQREVRDGITINRVPLYPNHDQSAKKRVLNYASFALSASLQGWWRVRKPEVVYVYHPPGTVGMPAIWLRRLRGAAIVYDIQDLWPDTINSTGMMSSSRLLRIIDRWMKRVYRACDRIVVLSPGFKKALIERGVPEEKIHVVYNWCDESGVQEAAPDPSLHDPSRFTILFAGTMGKAQGLDSVLAAARLCANQAPQVRFAFIGGGICRADLMAEASTMPNVVFLEPRKPHEMAPILAAADALLVHLIDDPLFRITIPSKTQAYLAAGKPLLMAVNGDAADLVRQADAGVVCAPQDPTAIAAAAMNLASTPASELAAMGDRGREFYRRELSMDVGVDRLVEVFEEAIRVRLGGQSAR